jgi:hypothetical protein
MDVFRGDVLGIIYISFWGFWHLKVQIILCFIDIIQPQAITMVILPPELRYFCYYVYDVNLTLESSFTEPLVYFSLSSNTRAVLSGHKTAGIQKIIVMLKMKHRHQLL